jgi:hypothetical protein
MAGIGAVGGYGFSNASWYAYSRREVSPNRGQGAVHQEMTAPQQGSAPQSQIPQRAPWQPTASVTGETPEELLQRYGSDPVGIAVRQRIRYGEQEEAPHVSGAPVESPAEVMEEGECQTCSQRKYQDGSDDPGVSFKTPAHIAPEQAAAVVRGHEMEHVTREQAKAEREDRKVVQQSVTLHTAICPECGKSYISGGTTRTTTAAQDTPEPEPVEQGQNQLPFSAVA